MGCKPEHYIQKSQIGEKLIANRKLFLSKRAVHSFGGYANQQLRRLENALAEDEVSQAIKEKHLLKSMQGVIESFKDKYTTFENGSMVLYCYLVPLLFFIPILNNGKTVPGNLDVANNTLWLFILEVGVTLLRRILSSLGLSLLSGVFGVLSTLVGILTLAAFICAISGNAFKIPKLGEIKIIK